MLLQTAFTVLTLPITCCLACTATWTACKFSKQDSFMLEVNSELLLRAAFKESNHAGIGNHLHVKSCHPTQYAYIFKCTTELTNFTFQRVCSNRNLCVLSFEFFKPVFRLLLFRRTHHLWISFRSTFS